jgi:hypothetical protein
MALANVEIISNLGNSGDYATETEVMAAADAVTLSTAAGDITKEVSGLHDADFAHLHYTMTIGQANNVRIYCYGLHATGGTLYLIPYKPKGAAEVDYYEVPTDANQSRSTMWEVNKAFPIYKWRALEVTDGGTDAVITQADVSASKR